MGRIGKTKTTRVSRNGGIQTMRKRRIHFNVQYQTERQNNFAACGCIGNYQFLFGFNRVFQMMVKNHINRICIGKVFSEQFG